MLQGSNDCARDCAMLEGSRTQSMLRGSKDLSRKDCTGLEGSLGVTTAVVGGLAEVVVVQCDVVVVGSTHV